MDRRDEETVMGTYDRLFKTLVAPVSFVLALTTSFFFYLGEISTSIQESSQSRIIVFNLNVISVYLGAFIIALLLWTLSLLINNRKLVKYIKFFSVFFLLAALIAIPLPIISTALERVVGSWWSIRIYIGFFAGFWGFLLILGARLLPSRYD